MGQRNNWLEALMHVDAALAAANKALPSVELSAVLTVYTILPGRKARSRCMLQQEGSERTLVLAKICYGAKYHR